MQQFKQTHSARAQRLELQLYAQDGLSLMVKSEGGRLIMRDVLRRPLAELELGETLAVMRRMSPTVIQVHLMLWQHLCGAAAHARLFCTRFWS